MPNKDGSRQEWLDFNDLTYFVLLRSPS